MLQDAPLRDISFPTKPVIHGTPVQFEALMFMADQEKRRTRKSEKRDRQRQAKKGKFLRSSDVEVQHKTTTALERVSSVKDVKKFSKYDRQFNDWKRSERRNGGYPRDTHLRPRKHVKSKGNIRISNKESVELKVDSNEKIGNLRRIFCDDNTRFLFDGQRVLDVDTVDTLGLSDGDIIEVCMGVNGGGKMKKENNLKINIANQPSKILDLLDVITEHSDDLDTNNENVNDILGRCEQLGECNKEEVLEKVREDHKVDKAFGERDKDTFPGRHNDQETNNNIDQSHDSKKVNEGRIREHKKDKSLATNKENILKKKSGNLVEEMEVAKESYDEELLVDVHTMEHSMEGPNSTLRDERFVDELRKELDGGILNRKNEYLVKKIRFYLQLPKLSNIEINILKTLRERISKTQ